jgi:hypothetical protein
VWGKTWDAHLGGGTGHMVKLLFTPEPIRGVDWYDPSGRAVVWSWLLGAAAAWVCWHIAGWLGGFWKGGGVGLAMVADLTVCALVGAIVPAVLTWRWYRTEPESVRAGAIRR